MGVDVKGNKYYRVLEKTLEGDYLERRMVKYSGDWEPADVPAEWLQWLRKVRKAAPTEVEMSASEAARQEQRARGETADAAAAQAAMRWQQGGGNSNSSGGAEFTQQLQQDAFTGKRDPPPPKS